MFGIALPKSERKSKNLQIHSYLLEISFVQL